MKIKFYRMVLKNQQISNFMKIRPAGAEILHAKGRKDGRTDIMTLTDAFRNFVNWPKTE
jgi:ribonucleotide reductase alpha subunit